MGRRAPPRPSAQAGLSRETGKSCELAGTLFAKSRRRQANKRRGACGPCPPPTAVYDGRLPTMASLVPFPALDSTWTSGEERESDEEEVLRPTRRAARESGFAGGLEEQFPSAERGPGGSERPHRGTLTLETLAWSGTDPNCCPANSSTSHESPPSRPLANFSATSTPPPSNLTPLFESPGII